MNTMQPGTGTLIKEWRQRRRMSQLDLALDDGDPAAGSMRAGTDSGTGSLTPVSSAAPLDDDTSYTVCASL